VVMAGFKLAAETVTKASVKREERMMKKDIRRKKAIKREKPKEPKKRRVRS